MSYAISIIIAMMQWRVDARGFGMLECISVRLWTGVRLRVAAYERAFANDYV